ncbi:MAG: putative oxidoreductase YdhV [Firmicutes bacterium ADurb.Bin182]|nr:MAG: putative oxidoreductase YdhV [Firmicutes bacterium ADurb.Bin182]
MRRIIRVDTRKGILTEERANDELRRIGGRHFIAHILNTEVDPMCEPLGRYNKLIVSLGLFADTGLSTTGKLSVGGKSPLTNGVKESNTGGFAGRRLSRLGIKSVIFEDIPEKETTNVLYLSDDEIKLINMPQLRHKKVSETFRTLRGEFGENTGMLCIGPAGEMKMCSAGIASTDDKGIQIRYAGRGGMGAVMGSKGIKAIVIKANRTAEPEIYDAALLNKTNKDIIAALLDDPKSKNRKLYGTIDILETANRIGIIPTRNFSEGSFEPANEWIGIKFSDLIKERGGAGRSGTPCVPGCTIQCSNVFPDVDGEKIVASLQYENLVLLGPNLGINDLDTVGELNHLCNEVGVDAIECGAALGIAMEAGVRKFGDRDGAKELIREIGEGTYLGRILGNGAVFTGRAFGIRRVPTVKGQAMPGYDPRALKGNGVTYFTSTMGADHTAGNCFETVRTNDPLGTENQVYNSRQLQIRAAILDTMGVCLFTRPAFVKNPELLTNLFKAKFGWVVSLADIRHLGAKVLELERSFNEKSGACERFNRIPEFMREEPLPPNNTVFDITDEEMERIWDVPVRTDIF